MSSVLVVIVLLGMWAFVLVPLVRQRNVRADEVRSVARFSSALRVLSRGHSVGSGRPGWGEQLGMRQWVMPPREGLAAVRRRRLAASAPAAPSSAAARRRRLILWLAGAVTLTLLLTLVAGQVFLIPQVLADCCFAAGIFACRWSVAAERATAARARRRRETLELRTSLHHAEALGASRSSVAGDVPVMTMPLASSPGRSAVPSAAPSGVPTMTVPLDAPALSRRAVPIAPAAPAVPVPAAAPAVPVPTPAIPAVAQHPGLRRAAPPRPRAEPVVLAEIDLDWERAIPEPSSCVRLVDLTGRSRRTPIFDESPAEGVDLGDDAGLDALVQRRLTASGW